MDKKLNIVFLLVVLVVGAVIGGCAVKSSPVSTEGNEESVKERSRSDYPPAPKGITDIDLQALDSEDFSIGDYKGDVVLINLWATWCAPCIEEMPYFNKLHEKYADDGFVMIGLNSDYETEAQVSAFVKRQKLVYKIGWAEESVVREFFKISNLPGIPQSLLINREGQMVGMFRGGGKNVIEQMVARVEKEMGDEKPNSNEDEEDVTPADRAVDIEESETGDEPGSAEKKSDSKK